MKTWLKHSMVVAVLGAGTMAAHANLLSNGNLDRTHAVEIVPGFFLPQPNDWQATGFKSVSGAYNDFMSSEPWAGPAPTPVTTDGNLNPPFPDGFNGPDGGVFFKAFTGSQQDLATGHLYQDVAATPGSLYTLTGWAGAEAQFSGLVDNSPTRAEFALEFYGPGNILLDSLVLDLVANGLGDPNGQAFAYREFSLAAVAPVGATTVRSRVSMIDGFANPAGGGQAFVVDDFTLTAQQRDGGDSSAVPEPASLSLLALVGLACAAGRRNRR